MISRRGFLFAQASFCSFGASFPSFAHGGLHSSPGQLLISGFRGTSSAEPEVDQVRRYIERGDVAGVMLLRRNIKSPEQLRSLTSSLQEASPDLPIIISVDQEGGHVTRLGGYNGFKSWMSAAELSRSGRSREEIMAYYTERAQELAKVGVNLNLGPVVDLNVNPFNPVIGAKGRAFGRSAEEVTRFAELFILSHRSVGVRTCLKHFPGHGSSFEDSHNGSADVSQTWRAEEIAPFERLVRVGLADSIMNSHVLHKYLSDEPWIPASLSKRSVTEMREGLKFDGQVISDDMQMEAITDLLPYTDACVAAVQAGNNLLIYSNYKDRYSIHSIAEVNEALRSAINEGTLNPDIIAERATIVQKFRASLVSSH